VETVESLDKGEQTEFSVCPPVRKKKQPRKKVSRLERKEHLIAFLFILPPVVGFLIFTAMPIVCTFLYSFQDYKVLTGEAEWIGFENFAKLFGNVLYAPLFWRSVGNTFIFLLSVPLSMILGLILAGLLRLGDIKGAKVFQIMYYLPAVSSAVALNIVWRYIFQSNGLLNTILGLGRVYWLGDPTLIKIAIIFKNSINAMGAAMILYLAGMLNVSKDLYEAASLDGASRIRQFFSITLPVISPVTFYLLITGLIGGLQSYTDSDVFAGGDPAASTIVFFVWSKGINEHLQGLASSASILLTVVIMLITLVQFKLSNKWVYED